MTSVDRVAEGSETIATEENCPPNLMVTLSLIQTLSLTGGGAVFLGGQLSEHRYRATK